MFDWDLTDCDQGHFDTKMMALLWFTEGVSPTIRRRVQYLQHNLSNQPLPFKGANARASLELDPVERPWNKAQAVFIGVMREYAQLTRETFGKRPVFAV